MKIKITFLLLLIFSALNFFGQTDSLDIDQIYSIPDTLTDNLYDTDLSDMFYNDNFLIQTQLQSQKLLKNLFLIGFIFMTFVVIFLFYINNVKIKEVLAMVKIQERQIDLKKFEIEKMSVILNNTIDAICIIDTQNKILWNNSSFISLYGYEKEELENKKIDFFTSENTNIQELLENAKNNKKPVQFTFDFKNKLEQTIFVQRRIIPISNQDNSTENFAIIDTDYTALKIALGEK
ncbi:MAG: PAS domain-containing protein [Bacteroidales bacterium]|nr:PAS domain-containing protein [Bacteroidales bacterium]